MLLSVLAADVKILSDHKDREITNITSSSQKTVPGGVFVCISGALFNGAEFVPEALSRGASVIVTEKDIGIKEQLIVENAAEAYSKMCRNYFGRSDERMSVIGITGTNGKTSVSFYIRDILKKFGCPSVMTGTVGNYIGDEKYGTEFTTPDPYELNRLLNLADRKNIRYAVIESSSQALDKHRLDGIAFDVGVFTNLTHDHLDYHGSMEAYARCKEKLFEACNKAVLNADDRYSAAFSQRCRSEVLYYSVSADSFLKADNIKFGTDGTYFETCGRKTHIKQYGEIAVYNALAAAGALIALGFDRTQVLDSLGSVKGAPGRLEKLELNKDFSVYIDYAHTPDGLIKAIRALRGITKNRLITLFGCGGDRDKTKRPEMGRAAVEGSDAVIITTDNPRTEDPDKIIADILEGTLGLENKMYIIPDREEAIRFSLSLLKPGDTLLLAGKGHEKYQITGENKTDFDERKIVFSEVGKD